MINIKDIKDFDIKKIADSGQCFRMQQLSDIKWKIAAYDKLSYVIIDHVNDTIIIDCNSADDEFWSNYFDLDTDYEKYRKSVDTDDIFLNDAVEYGKGIRILNQDPWEMLITFIISQRRSIPSIKTCVERLCRSWGHLISEDTYSFPSPEELNRASIEDLLDAGLGYRAEYVYLACKSVFTGDKDLQSFNSLDDDCLMAQLLDFRGVGPKVANCVSLFGYHRIAAFPVDVWIDRVQKEHYAGRFPIEKYKGFAGIMQQYIFYYARKK